MTTRYTLWNVGAFVAGAIASIPANGLLLAPLTRLLGAPAFPETSPFEDEERWRAFIGGLSAVHLLGPLIAHWNGAFVGSTVAALIAADDRPRIPFYVSAFVLLGGIANAFIIPGQPKLFLAIDFVGYIPMGYLGWLLVRSIRNGRARTA